ncbi:unnamed protein product, partial [Nesidiocoris tenuis]
MSSSLSYPIVQKCLRYRIVTSGRRKLSRTSWLNYSYDRVPSDRCRSYAGIRRGPFDLRIPWLTSDSTTQEPKSQGWYSNSFLENPNTHISTIKLSTQ